MFEFKIDYTFTTCPTTSTSTTSTTSITDNVSSKKLVYISACTITLLNYRKVLRAVPGTAPK